MSHVDACVDLLNEGSWDPAVANTTAYLTGFVFTVAKVKQSPVDLFYANAKRGDVFI